MLEGLKLGGSKLGETRQAKRQQQHQQQQQKQQNQPSSGAEAVSSSADQLRLRSANDLKEELASLRLSVKGRKPDLVHRLVEHYNHQDAEENRGGDEEPVEGIPDADAAAADLPPDDSDDAPPLSFAGLPPLSAAASRALRRAFGSRPEPTPIQSAAMAKLHRPPQPSAILHAPTGSGKTACYLLPVTEALWREVEEAEKGGGDVDDMSNGVALVLLPTRELAAQVAGVASVLAPRGTVRLVPRPTDLTKFWKDEELGSDDEGDGDGADGAKKGRKYKPRILVGSAKSVSVSLFGDGKLPAPPTSKPEGKKLLSSVRWLILDEVDRLLGVKKARSDKKKSRRHEKPAAMLSAAAARLTVGRVQVIAASATVGRPLRRELSRVLGLHSSECPETVRGEEDAARSERSAEGGAGGEGTHVGRAVRIPPSVRHYVLPADGSTSGSLLTSAAFACKSLLRSLEWEEASSGKILLVLTRGCGITATDAVGALRHFGIRPAPRSLLDALESDGDDDRLVEAHRRASGVEGAGGTRRDDDDDEGYLLVAHEDSVRGLHLDGLDAVVCVGRPGSPDEYAHVAGRTGRAGRRGVALTVASYEQAAALASWSKMLGCDFRPVDEGEVGGILD
ncbi:hypothetical protein ACHAWF_015813 [Thalassiosira exigua]